MDKIHVCTIASMFPYISITDVHVHLRRSGDRMHTHDMTHPSLARHTPQSLARACAVYTRYAVSRASPSYEVGNIDSDSKRISQEPTSTSIEEIES